MGRVVTALQVLDAGCDPNTLELITRKAEILIELYTEVGVSDRKKAVRFLRDKFTAPMPWTKEWPRRRRMFQSVLWEK